MTVIVRASAAILGAAAACLLLSPLKSEAQRLPPGYVLTPPVCYEEHAAGTERTVHEDAYGVPAAWHQQEGVLLASARPSPDNLPDDIKALPDLSGGDLPGAKDIPNLRATALNDRHFRAGDLFRDIKALQAEKLDDLLTADDTTRDKLRDILFLWFGVQDADPKGRGPFIDGRELAFLEKMNADRFVQLGKYPNPAPQAAGMLQQMFGMALYHYYAVMLMQTDAGELLDSGGKLDRDVVKSLAARAAALPTSQQRMKLWRNIVLAIPDGNLTRANQTVLRDAIAASAPGLTLEKALGRTADVVSVADDRTSPGGPRERDFSFYEGKSLSFDVRYLPDRSARRICYAYIEKK